MVLHTARLIITILFFILALAGLVTGYWFQALFWALLAVAVGYPFVRHGRIDLYYDDTPTKVVIYQPIMQPGAAPAQTQQTGPGPMPIPVTAEMPAAVQQLVQGTF